MKAGSRTIFLIGEVDVPAVSAARTVTSRPTGARAAEFATSRRVFAAGPARNQTAVSAAQGVRALLVLPAGVSAAFTPCPAGCRAKWNSNLRSGT